MMYPIGDSLAEGSLGADARLAKRPNSYHRKIRSATEYLASDRHIPYEKWVREHLGYWQVQKTYVDVPDHQSYPQV